MEGIECTEEMTISFTRRASQMPPKIFILEANQTLILSYGEIAPQFTNQFFEFQFIFRFGDQLHLAVHSELISPFRGFNAKNNRNNPNQMLISKVDFAI